MIKQRSNRSPAWHYFTKDYNNCIARCMICSHDFKVMPNHSTTNLLNHLRRNHGINPHSDLDPNSYPIPLDESPHNEPEQNNFEGMNPYAWLNFDKLNETTVVCKLCSDGKEIQLVPGEEQSGIVLHLAIKHPQAHKAYFGEDPHPESSQVPNAIGAAIESQMNELFQQPMKSISLKQEPSDKEVMVIGEDKADVGNSTPLRQHNPVPPQPQSAPASHSAPAPNRHPFPLPSMSHLMFIQNGRARRQSPSPSETTRTESPPLEKKAKYFHMSPSSLPGFDRNDDEFKALGTLIEKELRSMSLKDSNLATKYQITIQEELTKMKKEFLFKNQFR